jgi:flagellin
VQGAPAINLKPKATATVQSEQAKIRNSKMALAIATNNAALNAAAAASSVNKDMETSMSRLSSGKRINSASDDAAGVAISSRLSAEIRGTDQAIRNSLDGQALIDTAEGAHKEIENILQRMREVAVQAANDTNNDQDRVNLQAEVNALVTEINRIASTTTWAGEKLMEAELGTDFSFQVGAKTASENQISIKINGMGSHALGLKADPADPEFTPSDYATRQADISSAGIVSATDSNTSITLLGLGAGYADVTYDPADATSVNNAVTLINAGNTDTNISATVGAGAISDGKIILSHNPPASPATSAGSYLSTALADGDIKAAYASNSKPAATGEVIGNDMIIALDEDAVSYDIVLATGANGVPEADATVTVDPADLQATVDKINDGGGITGSRAGTTLHGYSAKIVASSNPDISGTIMLTKEGAGTADQKSFPGASGVPTVNQIDLGRIAIVNNTSSYPADMDVKTLPKALEAIVAIDEAIKTVNIQRSDLGAVSNRLSHTINNLTNISTNLSAAQGGIEDADFAHETTMLAKNQILQQASTAMLAQANASKQNVLSLLQG